MKKKLCVFGIVITIFICLTSTKSIAEQSNVTELREQRKELQEQISNNTLQLDELKGQISDLMIEIQDLTDRIYKYEIDVAVLDKEIDALNEKIADVEERYAEAEEMYNKRKELLATRMITQYEAGDTTYLDFLLNSNGLIDFISNYYIIGEIIDYDTDLMNSYRLKRDEINKTRQELDSYKKELKQKKDEQEKFAIVLSNIKVVKNNQMSKLTNEEIELQNQIDEYQKETQRIEVELLMILTANLGSEYVGGTLAWPVPGYTSITSSYGMRTHPISGIYKMHTGVDISAPLGAYFVAANDGTVVKSVYSASYGNMVVIDHGGGLSTLYAHGTERLVEEGEKVTRGQPVLTVGSTGISTGPHAHFEVRVNGMWTEPLDYILNRGNTNKVEEEQ